MPTSPAQPAAGGPRVLVVDDDAVVARAMAEFLDSRGYQCEVACGGEPALAVLEQAARRRSGEASALPDPFAVAIIDMAMPGMSGMEVIRRLQARFDAVVPLAITGYGTIESAVEAIRLGALDYLVKPVVDDELVLAVEKAHRRHTLVAENRSLQRQLDRREGLEAIIGDDPRMAGLYEVIAAVAPGRTTVLMCGESGTGKSLVARAIHRRSQRSGKPFVEVSCGSIPETLLESELFGHVKGAFTGAHTDKVGRFLAAHGGTLFLDEINSASPGMQLKLLRVLQERRFEPVGSTQTVEVDVRIVLASNQPLEELVARGEFRQDLYYRINVVSIELPPLRDRRTDIPVLARHFLARYAMEAGREVTGLSDEAIDAMLQYRFPGNVRELENMMERAVVLSRGPRIQLHDLPAHVASPGAQPRPSSHVLSPWTSEQWSPMPLSKALEAPERAILLAALEANQWNRQKTADDLAINRTTLYKKIKQYGLDTPCRRSA